MTDLEKFYYEQNGLQSKQDDKALPTPTQPNSTPTWLEKIINPKPVNPPIVIRDDQNTTYYDKGAQTEPSYDDPEEPETPSVTTKSKLPVLLIGGLALLFLMQKK